MASPIGISNSGFVVPGPAVPGLTVSGIVTGTCTAQQSVAGPLFFWTQIELADASDKTASTVGARQEEPCRGNTSTVSCGEKEVFVKRELDNLVTQMHAGGITYAEAVREFKRRFLMEVLAHHRGNQCKAATELGMHRNTLSRTIAELEIDPAQIRNGLKRPPRSERPVFETKQIVR